MKITNLIEGSFVSRPNRFTVEFRINNKKQELAHLHDPGRLKELLIPETKILVRYVEDYKKTNRKTKYDMIAVKNDDDWVLLNSSFHNKIVQEFIDEKKIQKLEEYHVERAEYTYGNSRLDFLLTDKNNEKMFLEVKGCTLNIDKTAIFPDAPTKRGTKHVEELIQIKQEGYESTIVILILHNKTEEFTPNYNTDPDFSRSLEKAYHEKINILPVHTHTFFKNNTLTVTYDKIIDLVLKQK